MLSLLISGLKQLGNDIDVFWELLLNELNVTWDEGVRTYNVDSRSFFNMKAILMWVIHDFPSYGNMVGFTTKGFYACPICGRNTNLVGSVCAWDIGNIF